MKRVFFLCLAGGVLSVAGCSFGRFSMDLNRDHAIPFPDVDVIPQQHEPEITDP